MDRILCFMLIFFGGGLGCLCRLLLDGNEHSPFSVSNICACILMGISYALLRARIWYNNKFIISFVNVGFLGGLSTFAPLAIYALQSHDGMFMKLFSMLGYLLSFWLIAAVAYSISGIFLNMRARMQANKEQALTEQLLLSSLPTPGETGRLLMFYEGYQQQLEEVVQEVEQLKALFASLDRPLNRLGKKDKLEEQQKQVLLHIVDCYSSLLTCSLALRIYSDAITPKDNYPYKTYIGLELYLRALKKQGFLDFEKYTVAQSLDLYKQWSKDFGLVVLSPDTSVFLLGAISHTYHMRTTDPKLLINNTVSYFFYLKSCVKEALPIIEEIDKVLGKSKINNKQAEAVLNKYPVLVEWLFMERNDVL